MRLLDWLRGESCPGAVLAQPLDDALAGPLEVRTLAGTQRIQGGLPPRTVSAWHAIAARFPHIKGLGAWGDRSHMARKSCHNPGKAIDAMTTVAADHEAIVAWALANRSQFGFTLIISRRRKWSAATGWKPRPYLGASGHYDHIHLSVDC